MEPEAPGAPPSRARDAAPRRRRRRRGRRGRPAGDAPAAATPNATPAEAAAPLVPSVSRLAAESAVAPEPLGPEEIAEMKEHLVFLREYKDALRLRLNAAEDLLVNGRREPSDRGVCRHLLGKVERGVIEAAIGREPLKSNAAARSRMLAGAIRLTADVGVLLAYLETLAPQRSHAEAAAAFAEVVHRIDFASLSATRLARLLQVLTETFQGQERVQVLFSLLDGDAFRRAFDAAAVHPAGAASLSPDVAAIFAPLRAVHRRLRGESDAGAANGDPQGLAVGLEQVMAAPDPVLRGYAEPLRVRMLELALDPGIPPALADRAAGVLLASLARAGKTFTRLAMRRAAQLLARHVDDRARATLEEVRRAAPGYHAAERWLAALAARHMGRVAIVASPPERGRLEAAFWLDGQRPVWLRTAAAADAARLAGEAELQAALGLPGVAPLVEHGVASGIPYVAVAAPGQPWRLGDQRTAAPDRPAALALATQAARILRALALADVALPDAEPERFCLAADRASSLTLADLDGARATTRAEAEHANAGAAAALAARLVPGATNAADLTTLVRDLDRALLGARQDPTRPAAH
ncbi:MAG: hypothetical protein IT293_10590 [Deltaproteobacteria bacterium]|nr:hypothetical protein [Deltaproteobacteria bacterium]